MMNWFKVFDSLEALTNNVIPNRAFPIFVNGERLLLIQSDKTFYAVQEKCPHNGASLVNGICSKTEITCPVHRYRFNVIDGKAISGGSFALNTYPIKIQENGIFIGFKAKWWQL